jgi:hypothetical protein
VEDESGNLDFLKVLREICFRKLLYAVVLAFDSAAHTFEPELIDYPLLRCRALTVVSIERQRKVLVKLGTLQHTSSNLVEYINTSIDNPPGLLALWSITGGMAPIRTALETRFVPWRPR